MRWLFAVVIGSFLLCAAQAETLAPQAFTETFVQRLKAAWPDTKVTIKGNLVVQAEGPNGRILNISLANLYPRYQSNPDGLNEFTVEPGTFYGVMRAQKEFPKRQHGLGLMVTEVARGLDQPELKSQFNDNSLMAGFDGWWFLDKRKNWVVSGWTAGTRIDGDAERIASVQTNSLHYFQRPDADEVRYDPTRTSLSGYGSRYWLNHQNGEFILNAAAGFMSPGFDVNDIGFMSRADVINYHVGGGWKWTKPTKHRKYQDWIGAIFQSWDFDGNNTNAGIWTQGSTEFQNNNSWNYRLAYNPKTTSTRRTRGGPRTTNLPGYEIGSYFDTDGKAKFFYFIDTGAYFQPEAHSQNWYAYPGVEFKPASNVTLRVGPGYEDIVEYAQYVTTVVNPANTDTYGADYVFATLHQKQISANIRLNWAFTPALSLQFFGQPLIAIGEYSDYKALAQPNSFAFNPYPIAPMPTMMNGMKLIRKSMSAMTIRVGSGS